MLDNVVDYYCKILIGRLFYGVISEKHFTKVKPNFKSEF